MYNSEKQKIELDYSRLPPAPQVLIKLIDLFNQSDVSFEQLEDLIAKDSALSAKVISIANSAAYSQWNETRSLKQILVVLGIKTIKTITMTSAVHQFFSQFSNELGELLGSLWLDALICAHLTRQLATLTEYDNPDEAYLAGLLHQLGQLVFVSNDPSEYQSILKSSSDQNALLFSEQQRYGIHSAELAADIIKGWQIDSFLQDAVRYQYKSADLLQDANPLVKILNLSSSVCNRLNHSNKEYLVEDHFFGLNQSLIDDLLLQSTEAALTDSRGFDIKINEQSSIPRINIDDEAIRIELARRVRQIALLDGVHQQINQFENITEMMQGVSESLQLLFGLSSTMFFFPDSSQTTLSGISSHSKNQSTDTSYTIQIKTGRSLVTEAALQHNILNSQQQRIFTELPVIDQQIQAVLKSSLFICLPLFSQQILMGVLAIGCEIPQLDRLMADHELLLHFSSIIADAMAQQQASTYELEQQQQLIQQENNIHIRKVIHEVNNPLTIINNYLEIISMEMDEDSDHAQHLGAVKSEIDRIGELLVQFRDDQQVMQQTMSEDKPEVDINLLINNLITLFKPTFYKINNIQSELELDPALPLIITNQNKLKQLLSNLLKNAAEALPEQGIIRIQSKALVIVNNKKFIQLSISDNGSGIPEHILENLFSPVKTTKGANHSGLGLTIVHNLVAELKGAISYSTAVSGGAEFIILLPKQ